MKTFKIFSLWMLLGLFFATCSNPCGSDSAQLLEKFQHFLSQKSERAEHEARDREFRNFIKECYPLHEAKMDLSQKKDFWIGVLRYYYQRYGMSMIVKLKEEKDIRAALIEGLKDIGIDLEKISLADLIKLL